MAGLTTHDVKAKARQRIAQITRHGDKRDDGRGKESPLPSALASLGAGWQRIDDIQWPGYEFANVDHVLVGPAGLFVIDVQHGTKLYDLGEDAAMRRHARLPKREVEDVVSAAHAVGSLLGMVHRRPMAVLCLVDERRVEATIGEALVCSPDTMIPRLNAMAPILDETQVREISERLAKDLVLVTGRLAAVPSQRTWKPDPGTKFELPTLDHPRSGWRRRTIPLVAAAAVATGIGGYAATHLDDAFKTPVHHNHVNPNKGTSIH
jgi:Nuclease-related domain